MDDDKRPLLEAIENAQANFKADVEEIPFLDSEDEEKHERYYQLAKRAVPYAITGVAIILFSALGWYAYQFNHSITDPNQVPLIQADKSIFKYIPKEPGGIEIPHQDKEIYQHIHTPAANLTEAVTPKPSIPAAPERKTETQKTIAEKQKITPVKAVEQQPTVQKTAKPEETLIPKKSTAKTTQKVTSKTKAQTITKVYRIQLGSYKNYTDAQRGWKSILKKHMTYLQGLEPTIVKKNIPEKGVFYRLQAGPIAKESLARDLCKTLKRKKQGCLFVKG